MNGAQINSSQIFDRCIIFLYGTVCITSVWRHIIISLILLSYSKKIGQQWGVVNFLLCSSMFIFVFGR